MWSRVFHKNEEKKWKKMKITFQLAIIFPLRMWENEKYDNVNGLLTMCTAQTAAHARCLRTWKFIVRVNNKKKSKSEFYFIWIAKVNRLKKNKSQSNWLVICKCVFSKFMFDSINCLSFQSINLIHHRPRSTNPNIVCISHRLQQDRTFSRFQSRTADNVIHFIFGNNRD